MYICSQHLAYAEFKTPSVFSLCCHFLQVSHSYNVCCAFSNLLIGQGLVCVHVDHIGVCQSYNTFVCIITLCSVSPQWLRPVKIKRCSNTSRLGWQRLMKLASHEQQKYRLTFTVSQTCTFTILSVL